MLKNYLKATLRNMGRNKVHSLINIAGLAVGMAACIIIVLFVRHELSYDTYHENEDRIYRVSRQWFNESGESSLHLGHVAPPFGPLLKSDFPDVIETSVRMLRDNGSLLKYQDKAFVEDNFFFAEKDLFSLFTLDLVNGDPQTVLAEPNSMVISASAAQKYFGSEDPMGKSINYSDMLDMKVTGVFKDMPGNSHFHADFFCSFQTVEDFFGRENLMRNWGSNNYSTFLLLADAGTVDQLEAQLPAFLDRHMDPVNGVSRSTFNKLHLWPLTDIHLHSHLDSEIEPNGDIAYVYIFSIVAFLILLIACINFINLSTARASRRIKEVGMRKVLGADRWALIKQFMAESVIMTLLALGIALLIVSLVLPYLNTRIFPGQSLTLFQGGTSFFLLLLLGITILVGIIAGSYPAFFLSSFQPQAIFSRLVKGGSHKSSLRSTLVVTQFAISIALIVGVVLIQQQVEYCKSKPLGFNKENLVTLDADDEMFNNYENFKKRLLQHPGIIDVTLSSRVPSGRLLDSQGGSAEVKGEMKPLNIRVADVHVDHDYLKALGVTIVAGRDFDIRLASDSTQAFILNEAAIKAIGWDSPEEAVNKKFEYGRREGRVVGVAQDFHFESLHQSIAPIVFLITSGRGRTLSVRMHEAARTDVMSFLQERWTAARPDYPFSYSFISESFDEQYENEDRLAELIGYFSLLGIIIAVLGLFGLASFMAEQRFREIGIRKVLGASASQIPGIAYAQVYLTGFDSLPFGKCAVIFLIRKWLGDFAYQTEITPWPFLIAGLAALFIAWITVSWQSLKAANINPVEAIRYE